MEAINNIANAAVGAVWSGDAATDGQTDQQPRSTAPTASMDTAQEPLSGVLGNPQAGEPYDAGNMAEQEAVRGQTLHTSSSDGSMCSCSCTVGNAYSTTGNNNNNNNNNGIIYSSTTGMNNSRVPSTGVDGGSVGQTRVNGLGGGAAAGMPAPAPAPAPVAGRAGLPAAVSAVGSPKDGPLAESRGKGTGEKYIRSTGLYCDGGDFDAAREGAGREAERLMIEKGIIVTKGKKPDFVSQSSVSSREKKRRSWGERIKDKLRKQ